MNVQQSISLQAYNTLAVPAVARYFVEVHSDAQLREAITFSEDKALARLILGGGSNIVLSSDFDGLVIHLCMQGIESLEVSPGLVQVSVAAGENWDELVRHSLAQGWYGLENLSAIPGNVGAAPIQNIGAYGVEVSSVLDSVLGLDTDAMEYRKLTRTDCELAYRDSIFKRAWRDRFVITRVNLQLSREPAPVLSYPALVEAIGDREPTPEQVAETVRRVRGQKLPSPSVMPNAGSFFKNPLVSEQAYRALKAAHPDIPAWSMAAGYKLAAGWLLEQAGWRGFSGEGELAGVGTYHNQSLVLINPGSRQGSSILQLADQIKASVFARFGVSLEIEPRVY
ncbi:MAG: UDP-N-acetylmuramate dehydrogenase [Paracoccaceae bacterium]